MNIRDIQQTNPVTTGSVAKYVFLPGILPRLKHFGYLLSRIMFIFVQIFVAAGLVERNHPCARPENIGRYSFGSVVALAWSNVRFTRQTAPQAILFCSVIASLVLIVGMLFAGSGYVFSQVTDSAHAQYFSTPDNKIVTGYSTSKDWAFLFLDRVFGDSSQTGIDFFSPDGATNGGGNPWYTAIFIGLLKTYSQALMMIALIMILYLIVITLVDAATSGKPFGTNFDSVWAPIRFAIALGLLAPMTGGGYNGAQILTFEAAQLGSSLATNLWHRGIQSIGGAADQNLQYVSASVSDPGYRLVRDMFLINMCVFGYNQLLAQGKIEAVGGAVNYEPVMTQDDDNYTFQFGIPETAPNFCGEVIVPKAGAAPVDFTTASPNTVNGFNNGVSIARNADDYFPKTMTTAYLNGVKAFMPPTSEMQGTVAELVKGAFCDVDKNMIETPCPGGLCSNNVQDWIYTYWRKALGREGDPTASGYTAPNDYFLAKFNPQLRQYNAWLSEGLMKDAAFGWASAGVFYLRMASALGEMDKATSHPAYVSKLPANFTHSFATPREPSLSDKDAMNKCGMNAESDKVCKRYAGSVVLSRFLHKGADFFASAPKSKVVGNKGLDFYRRAGGFTWDSELKMAANEQVTASSSFDIMGPVSSYLLNKVSIDGTKLNPLGQVIDWGNNMLEASTILYGISTVTGILYIATGNWIAQGVSSITATVGSFFVIPGFMLMFVIPLMPFLYFAFALVEWIASIIEALIGMPLWALSFITLRGDVFEPAKAGGKMLFEIVLRPSVTVMALVGSILIFTATVSYFNDAIFLYMDSYVNGVTPNVGAGARVFGSIAMIFVYMLGIYMLAMSCFKLIVIIPEQFGRWISIGSGFNATTEIGASAFEVNAASYFMASKGQGIVDTAKGSIERKLGVELADAIGDKEIPSEVRRLNAEIRAGYRSPGDAAKVMGRHLKAGTITQADARNIVVEMVRDGFIGEDAANEMLASFVVTNPALGPSFARRAQQRRYRAGGGGGNPSGAQTGGGYDMGQPNFITGREHVKDAVTGEEAEKRGRLNSIDYYDAIASGDPANNKIKITGISGRRYEIARITREFATLGLPSDASVAQAEKALEAIKQGYKERADTTDNARYHGFIDAYEVIADALGRQK